MDQAWEIKTESIKVPMEYFYADSGSIRRYVDEKIWEIVNKWQKENYCVSENIQIFKTEFPVISPNEMFGIKFSVRKKDDAEIYREQFDFFINQQDGQTF